MTQARHGLLRLTAILAIALTLWWLATGAPQLTWAGSWWLAAAAVLYLMSHVLRGLRLLLLIYDGKVRFREVMRAHLFAAGVSRLVPFKLGEFYRIALVDCLVANPSTAIATVIIERAYDIAFIALIIASGLMLGHAEHPSAMAVLAIAGAAMIGVTLSLVVLPELLPLLKRYLVLRHNSERSLLLLRAVDRLDLLLVSAVGRWRQRRAAVSSLSAAVWALEVGVLLLAVRGVGLPGADALVDAVLELVLQGSLSGGGEVIAAALPGYLMVTAVPLAVVALLIGLLSPFRRHPHPPIAQILDRPTPP